MLLRAGLGPAKGATYHPLEEYTAGAGPNLERQPACAERAASQCLLLGMLCDPEPAALLTAMHGSC